MPFKWNGDKNVSSNIGTENHGGPIDGRAREIVIGSTSSIFQMIKTSRLLPNTAKPNGAIGRPRRVSYNSQNKYNN